MMANVSKQYVWYSLSSCWFVFCFKCYLLERFVLAQKVSTILLDFAVICLSFQLIHFINLFIRSFISSFIYSFIHHLFIWSFVYFVVIIIINGIFHFRVRLMYRVHGIERKGTFSNVYTTSTTSENLFIL